MVVLFGDHGENMTEHDAWFDHAGLYDSVIHVPLMLWAPGKVPVAESDAMVTLVDVLPTILETLDLPEAEGISGRSLYPLMRGETTTHRDAVMLSEATWQASRAVRTPEWKYIRYLQSTIYGRDGVELYDVVGDPDEQHNVAAEHPEVVDELGGRLDHWVSAQLGGRPDPMLQVIDAGLPAVARLNDVIAGLTRPRNDVPTPSEPELVLVPLATAAPDGSGPSDHLDPSPGGDGGQFAPRNPHRRRLRGARGVVVGALMLGAAVLLGVAVNDLLLSAPLSAAGVIEPTQAAELNMPSSGTLTAIMVHVGEVVHAGQELASQDTTALDAKLASDQANLATDQSTLVQEQSGSAAQQAQQVQTLQNQLTMAQLQALAAQQKLTQTTATGDASVQAAQAQVRIEQSLLVADQQTYADNAQLCVSANPPSTCASDQRQVQVDQGDLTAAQSALAQATANQQSSATSAQDAVTQATSAVAAAQASLTAGSAPGSPQQRRRGPGAGEAGHGRHRLRPGQTGPGRADGAVRRCGVGRQRHGRRGRHQPGRPPGDPGPAIGAGGHHRDPDLPPGPPDADLQHPVERGTDLPRLDAGPDGRPGPRDPDQPDPRGREGQGDPPGRPWREPGGHGQPDRADPGGPVRPDLLPGRPGQLGQGRRRARVPPGPQPRTDLRFARWSDSRSTSPSEGDHLGDRAGQVRHVSRDDPVDGDLVEDRLHVRPDAEPHGAQVLGRAVVPGPLRS